MAFWPRDERSEKSHISKRDGTVKHQSRNYPYLEPGLIGAATLSGGSQLGWTMLTTPWTHDEDLFARRLKFGKHVEAFPPTRTIPVKTARASIKERAEQGANFLRTHLPEVEIPAELIREQLIEDTTLSWNLEQFNPYLGDFLEIFSPEGTLVTTSLLFPTGGTACDLNFCSITSLGSCINIAPYASPLYTFPTPIQQLAVSDALRGANLAVRTFGSVDLFHLGHSDEFGKLLAERLATFLPRDFSGDTVVDVKHRKTGILTVGHEGTVFECRLGNGSQMVTQLYQQDISAVSLEEVQGVWRLALDKSPHCSFLMSNKIVAQLDDRTKAATTLLTIPGGKHVLTSIEDMQRNDTLQLCSTDNVIWLDPRFPGKPLLAYAHGREYDRYLSTKTVALPLQDNPFTFLSSRNNTLVTVYDMCQSMEGLVQLRQSPYFLPSSPSIYEKHHGQQFFWIDDEIFLVRLSERGAVTCTEILPSNEQKENSFSVKKTKELRDLEATASTLQSDAGSLIGHEFSQVDVSPSYSALFKKTVNESKTYEKMSETLNQLLDYFPVYLRNKELPSEHMLTTYDIAFRAGDEPERYSRADFLAEGVLNSTQAFEALKHGRLAPQLIKAPWHKSIVPTLRRLDKDFVSDPQGQFDQLQKYNLDNDKDDAGEARNHKLAACHILAVDLALASHIFSESPFLKPSEVDQSLETMTEALSLGGESHPIEFGYLRPLEKRPAYLKPEEETPSEQPEIPMGVRLLLKEWDTSSPEKYIYHDPYSNLNIEGNLKPTKFIATQLRDFVVQTQRPPPIMASGVAALPPVVELSRREVPKVQSQEPFMMRMDFDSQGAGKTQSGSSQELVTSTQVLPGPHGGRPPLKKQPAKKRLGGF